MQIPRTSARQVTHTPIQDIILLHYLLLHRPIGLAPLIGASYTSANLNSSVRYYNLLPSDISLAEIYSSYLRVILR